MQNLFLSVLWIGIRSTVLILCILLIRIVTAKRCNRTMSILWLLVAIRLLIPFSVSISSFPDISLWKYNSIEYAGITGTQNKTEQVDEVTYSSVKDSFSNALENGSNNETEPLLIRQTDSKESISEEGSAKGLINVLTVLWIIGFSLFASYNMWSYFRLRKRVSMSIPSGEVRICDGISQPFILGVFKSTIYIPSDLKHEIRDSVIAHEKVHISRGDYSVRLLYTFVLMVHWFNPLVWLAFRMSERDMEMACDDAVTRQMSKEKREEYLAAVIHCSKVDTKNCCQLGFANGSVKERIENIAHPSHAKRRVIFACVIIGVGVFVCTLVAGKKGASKKEELLFGQKTIVCGENYIAQILPDGTVRATMIPGETGICEVDFEEIGTWKDIVSLRAGNGKLYGYDKDGNTFCSSALLTSLRQNIEAGTIPESSAPILQLMVIIPTLDDMLEKNELVDGEMYDTRSQVILKRNGMLQVYDMDPAGSGGENSDDRNPLLLSEDDVITYEDDIFLRENGTIGCINEKSGRAKGYEIFKEKKGFCGIAENSYGIFGVQKDGKVLAGTVVYAGIIDSWENVVAIRAAGELVVALHNDGTVSVALPNGNEKPQIHNVEQWKNIAEIDTNGTTIVGKTIDGNVVTETLE